MRIRNAAWRLVLGNLLFAGQGAIVLVVVVLGAFAVPFLLPFWFCAALGRETGLNVLLFGDSPGNRPVGPPPQERQLVRCDRNTNERTGL